MLFDVGWLEMISGGMQRVSKSGSISWCEVACFFSACEVSHGSDHESTPPQSNMQIDHFADSVDTGPEWGEVGYYRVVRGSNHCGLANFAVHSVLTEVKS